MNILCKKKLLTSSIFLTLAIQGCGTLPSKQLVTNPINHLRDQRLQQQHAEKANDVSLKRSQAISILQSETSFIQSIKCLSQAWYSWQLEDKVMQNRGEMNKAISFFKSEGLEEFIVNERFINISAFEKYFADQKRSIAARNRALIQKNSNMLFRQEITELAIKKIAESPNQFSDRRNKLRYERLQRDFFALRDEVQKNKDVIEQGDADVQKLENSLKVLSAIENLDTRSMPLFKVSVAPVYDKTAKIYPESSTALSEIVAHSLSYNAAIHVVDTPYNTESALNSRVKLGSDVALRSVGSVLPSDFYVSGAVVQYDEGTQIPYVDYLRLNMNILDVSKEVKSVTVSVLLRLVQGADGLLYFSYGNTDFGNSGDVNLQNPPSSVLVTNTFYTQDTGGGLLRIIGSKNWGIDAQTTVSDPKMYAVREMVDYAVYELLKRAVPSFDTKSPESHNKVEWASVAKQCDRYLPRLPESQPNHQEQGGILK